MGKKHKKRSLVEQDKRAVVPMEYRMKRINAKNILQLTPNELYETWSKNKNRMESIINRLRNEILFLQKKLKMVNQEERYRIIREIEHKQDEIKICQNRFEEWIGEIERSINLVVKSVFEKLLKGASKEQISNIVMEFSNTFSQSRYGDYKLEKILICFVENYKMKITQSQNVVNKVGAGRDVEVRRGIQPISYNPYEIPKEVSSFNDIRDITGYEDVRDMAKVYDNNKQNMRFFSISIFYGSIGDKKSMKRRGHGKMLNNMLLGAVDAMTNFLYGNIRESMDDIYNNNDKK